MLETKFRADSQESKQESNNSLNMYPVDELKKN